METRTILVLLGLLTTAAAAADTWMWTDDEGVVHYSDRPYPGAERITIDEPNASQAPARRANNAARDTTGTTETSVPARLFQSCRRCP